MDLIFLNGSTPASFKYIFIFSNTHYKFYKVYEKMSILYMVPGFELTTCWTGVFSHNH